MKIIVLVEDDPAIRDAMHFILSEAEYRLIVYSSAEEVLSENIVPDIFLVDKQLSGANGLALCRRLKRTEKTKNIPVIMLSASPNIKQLAQKAGADDAIEKPFTPKQLQEKISQVFSEGKI